MYICGFRINAKLVKESSFRINAKLVKEELNKIIDIQGGYRHPKKNPGYGPAEGSDGDNHVLTDEESNLY